MFENLFEFYKVQMIFIVILPVIRKILLSKLLEDQHFKDLFIFCFLFIALLLLLVYPLLAIQQIRIFVIFSVLFSLKPPSCNKCSH